MPYRWSYSAADARPAPAPVVGLDPAAVFSRATATGDPHAIKFADTSVEVYGRIGDPLLLGVAVRCAEQLG